MDDTQSIPPQNDDTEIVDAEIVSSETKDSDDQSTILLSLDEMIKTYISSLDRMRDEQKKLREMIADGCNNDASYKEADTKAKEAAKVKSAAKQQVMNKPGVMEIANKLKSVNSEIKEKQVSLSDYLLEYQRLSGANQFEIGNGEILEIIQVAKVVKKFSK